MNNMNFSLTRYLNLLGAEAHLLMFNNEYKHFLPENDTWNIDAWKDKIHVLPFSNNGRSLLKTRASTIHNCLKGFDIYLGCGLAPAYLYKAGMILDCFNPYDVAIEATYDISFNDFIKKPIRYSLYQIYVKPLQIKGVKKARISFCSSFHPISQESLKRLCIPYLNYTVPMVFNKEEYIGIKLSSNFENILQKFGQHDFILFSHSRQYWKKLRNTTYDKYGGKRNDILIEGFAKYLKYTVYKSPVLVLFEYGTDIDNSKKLINNLGIEKYVIWLPLLSRREIILLIKNAHVCADQFGKGGYWGSTGWEILSQGKPMLANFNVSYDEYISLMYHEPPFIMNSKTSDDIIKHLIHYQENPEFFNKKAAKNKEWFDSYAGIGLAKKYLQVMQKIYDEKQIK